MNFIDKSENRSLLYEKNNSGVFASNEEKCSYCLAFQCAPVLAGIKASNLLIIKENLCNRAKKEISEAGTNYNLLCSFEGKFIYLIYKKKELMNILTKAKVISYLNAAGYQLDAVHKIEFHYILKKLGQRLKESIRNKKDFPHEIGIFMGYPIEDVLAFVKNEGHNYELSGYWKVYHKKELALRLFKQYDLARTTALKHIKRGGSLSQLRPLYTKAYRESLNKSNYCMAGV